MKLEAHVILELLDLSGSGLGSGHRPVPLDNKFFIESLHHRIRMPLSGMEFPDSGRRLQRRVVGQSEILAKPDDADSFGVHGAWRNRLERIEQHQFVWMRLQIIRVFDISVRIFSEVVTQQGDRHD